MGEDQPPQAPDRGRRRARRSRSSTSSSRTPGVHAGARGRQRRRAGPRRRARRTARAQAVHGGGNAGPTFAPGEAVDHAANGFNPTEMLRDFDWGKTTPARERPRPARVDAGRRRQGDRGRPGRQVPGLDLQRPGAGADAALPRGRAAAGPLRQRLRAPAHDPLPRAASRPRWTGCPGIGAGLIQTGGRDHLRVRRRAVRPAPLPLPRRARWPSTSRAASTAPSSSIRSRAGPRPTRW